MAPTPTFPRSAMTSATDVSSAAPDARGDIEKASPLDSSSSSPHDHLRSTQSLPSLKDLDNVPLPPPSLMPPSDAEEELEIEAEDPPPDSGLLAWTVVIGALLANLIAFGLSNAAAVFLRAYTQPGSRFADAGTLRISFIGGCSVGFAFISGPFSNLMISKLGVRAPVAMGVFLMVFALEMASLATAWWHLLLSQGILFGLGASFVFLPAIGLPSQYFVKKRALATGVASSGSGIGALILAPIAQAIMDKASIPWALRSLGFITLGLGTLCVILLRPRPLKKGGNGTKVQYKALDFSVLKTPGFSLYLLTCFLTLFGYSGPLFLIGNYCRTIDISATHSAGVVSVMAAGNIVGRISSGVLADRLGPVTVLLLFDLLAGLTCLVILLFARSLAVVMVWAVLWGIGAGAYWALSVPVVAKVVGLEKLGSAVSFSFLTNVVPPIFGAAIATSIQQATARSMDIPKETPEAYRYVIVLNGLWYLVTAALLLLLRGRYFGWTTLKV